MRALVAWKDTPRQRCFGRVVSDRHIYDVWRRRVNGPWICSCGNSSCDHIEAVRDQFNSERIMRAREAQLGWR